MRLFNKYMLLALAIMAAAQGCDKEPIGTKDTGAPIMLSASEAGTKALLDNEAFKTTGNRIQVYDFVTEGTTTIKHIDAYAGPDVESNSPLHTYGTTWPFESKKTGKDTTYQWIPGTHKFFGWLAKDANFDNPETKNIDESIIADAFFALNENSFNETTKVLTIPAKAMIQGEPQFDFMYSNIHTRDLNTNPSYSAVPLEFSHLFTAFSVAAQNTSTKNKIKVNSVTITGLKNNKKATIDFKNATDTSDPSASNPNVTYETLGSSGNFVFEPEQLLGTNLVDLSNKKYDEREYFLMWPMTAAEAKTVTITVIYTLDDEDTPITKSINLPASAWDAGQKNNINLIFKEKEIILQCLVADWIPKEEIIDFSDQVMVRDTISWNKSTIKNINYETGEVILYDDVDIQAICNFHIETPKGATWTASLIPIEGHQDAFKFVESTKYGAVGTDSQVNLVVNNQVPIAPRHVCILRITVQTADGRTIVVKNLVPDERDYEEFKIVQNLING